MLVQGDGRQCRNVRAGERESCDRGVGRDRHVIERDSWQIRLTGPGGTCLSSPGLRGRRSPAESPPSWPFHERARGGLGTWPRKQGWARSIATSKVARVDRGMGGGCGLCSWREGASLLSRDPDRVALRDCGSESRESIARKRVDRVSGGAPLRRRRGSSSRRPRSWPRARSRRIARDRARAGARTRSLAGPSRGGPSA